ncbi:hypothetical protein BGZ95_010328 [Linnemannia exigua]|uniref:Uncharacterized protein n=1 Tax=Linnemannia exigua TaxID=604196 RepID=A0AAD4DD82_9FUNG|nr:hypothetical protein BGZ95_010328 [Linnemannia exigua]
MSDYTKELHDPAAETHLEEALEDGDNASSGILLERADYDHSSPEVTSLNSSTILDHLEDDNSKAEHGDKSNKLTPTKHAAPAIVSGTPVSRPVSGAVPIKLVNPAGPLSSTELSTDVVDLNQTMPWKILAPFISRETVIWLSKATAINFFLPFINGVFLGFGEICAHELAYRWGWINSAHVVNVPGRRAPVAGGSVGLRAAGGSSGPGSSGYAGSRSGIGGLGRFEDEFEVSNNTATTSTDSHHRQDNNSISNNNDILHPHLSSSLHSSYSSPFNPSADNSDGSNNKKDSTSSYNPYKRKHPLQFEPDFFAALDASLQDLHDDAAQRNDTNGCWKSPLSNLNGDSPWLPRPCKRARSSFSKCPTSQSIGSTSRDPVSLGSSSTQPQAPSPAPAYLPIKATMIPRSANRNSETIDDPHRNAPPPPVFPQGSPLSAWSHRHDILKSPAFARNSKGPSIIDLSSGEELVPMHMDDKEQLHKRRRNSLCEPSSSSSSESADSLHQVFELQADGTLLPIEDPSPTDRSPAKRMRLSKANRCPYLHFLSDDEAEIERLSTKLKADLRRRKTHNGFIGSNRTHRTTGISRAVRSRGPPTTVAVESSHVQEESCLGSNRLWADQSMDAAIVSNNPKDEDTLADQACQLQVEEPNVDGEEASKNSNSPGLQAMVLYKGPRSVSLTPNRQFLDWDRWLEDETDYLIGSNGLHGHEVVLYQRERLGRDTSSQFSRRRSIPWDEDDFQDDDTASSVLIEELDEDEDEDDGNLADDEEYEQSDDVPLMELEEQITDMDLD